MKTWPLLLVVSAMAGPTPAHAATPGVYWDCRTVSARPPSVDLNCQHADATLTSLRWNGRSARGFFNFPSYPGATTLQARVTVSRPRIVAGASTYTRLTVKLFGNKRDREGLPRHMRYFITCDRSQGWIPARVAKPC